MILESFLDTALGLAAMLLGLSLLAQVVQELWKYMLSTKASLYTRFNGNPIC